MSRDSGFTLVELMVVVLIIGILIAIAVPMFTAAKATAQTTTCFANQRMIEGAAQSYIASKGVPPSAGTVDGTNVLITGGFLKSPPQCPLGLQNYDLDASATVTQACLTCGHRHY